MRHECDADVIQLSNQEYAYPRSVLEDRVGSVQWTPQAVELPMSRYDIQNLVVRMKTVKD